MSTFRREKYSSDREMRRFIRLCALLIPVFAIEQDAHADSDALRKSDDVTLKCKNSGGDKMADLVVDLEAGTMTWAFLEFKIIHVDPDYITAFRTFDKVGGQIWVLHRSSGQFWRAAVGEYCDGSDCSSMHMGTSTYEGICRANMF